jgi:hypothetical protein
LKKCFTRDDSTKLSGNKQQHYAQRMAVLRRHYESALVQQHVFNNLRKYDVPMDATVTVDLYQTTHR